MFATANLSGIGAPPSTTAFIPVFIGPEEDGLIGFLQEQERGVAAFDNDKLFLDLLQNWTSACDVIRANCLGIIRLEDQPRVEAFVRTPRLPEEPEADTASKILPLAEGLDVIEITELEPANGTFAGKQIDVDGNIIGFPKFLKYWWQSVATVPATIPHLFAYLCEARKRNICLIRGAPANPEQQQALRKLKVNFNDTPTRLFWLDLDGVQIKWRDDPEQAIRTAVAMLGEPWASASFVWYFSGSHGLEIEKQMLAPPDGQEPDTPDGQKPDKPKRWTGRISDNDVRVRIVFLAERNLNEAEAVATTLIAKAKVPAVDKSSCYRSQINYIRRPHWVKHPDRDPLGDCPSIGWVKGTSDTFAVPDNLAYTAKWAGPQGRGGDVAVHPDAESAIRGIGSDGSLRSHLRAAVEHLLRANPVPEVVSFADHSITITNELRNRVEQHRQEICGNLTAHGRHWSEMLGHISEMAAYASWCLNHPGSLRTRTIKLIKEERAKVNPLATREEIFARVKRATDLAYDNAMAWAVSTEAEKAAKKPPVILLVAPPGSRKSTLLRTAAVRYVTEHPNKTVVILVPLHKLGDEQIKALRTEHPTGNYSAAIWRGRHADDPDSPDPEHPGKFLLKMCRRPEEAASVADAQLDVDSSLCKHGRGKNVVKCPFYDDCPFQKQKQVEANIWFAAHECAAHEMPATLGDVGWVIIDEDPLDAFMFGVDSNDQVTIGLDSLRQPLLVNRKPFAGEYDHLMKARRGLYHALDRLPVPIDFQQGIAVPWENLKPFVDKGKPGSNSNPGAEFNAGKMYSLTWRGKVDPKIRPDMSEQQVALKLKEAAGNATIKMEARLWKMVQQAETDNSNTLDATLEKANTPEELIQLVEAADRNKLYGRIQVQRGEKGRDIRLVGVEKPATGWEVPTLICDATADAELLKAIWPQLEEPEPHGWEQMPRPAGVRTFQCVNRTYSKGAVAVDGKTPEETERKVGAARRLYAAVLRCALEYGGQVVGLIVYKSTRDWIEKHCSVPKWLKIIHWGEHLGTNKLQNVRALFVVGRWLPPSEGVARATEALFGGHITDREYRIYEKQGRIPIVPDTEGNNCILVDVRQHPHPLAERVRRHTTEGNIIQAVERARAGLRGSEEPLDIHLWTNIPIPELGPVEPVLESELDAGPDGLMLADGCWMKNKADAVLAFKGLFTTNGLKSAGVRAGLEGAAGGVDRYENSRGVGAGFIGDYIKPAPTPRDFRNVHDMFGANQAPIFRAIYQREGAGCKLTEAVFLTGIADPRGWLEERLGQLAHFEVVGVAGVPEPAAATPGRGRPPADGNAMSDAMRMRRMRARRKGGKNEAV